MKLTVEELRTLQLALINMEAGLTESGIAKMQSLSSKLEVEAQRLTKRALDVCQTCQDDDFCVGDYCPQCGTRH